MKIGFEVKPFNYNLKSRRLELGYTQKELAFDARVQIEFIGQLELLKMPGKKVNIIRAKMNRVADCLEVDFCWLFPQDYLDAIQHELLPRRKKPMVWAIDMNMIQLSLDNPYFLPSPEVEIIEQDVVNVVKDVLDSLSDKERDIIERHYGLNGHEPATLEKIGEAYGDNRERIRQLEAKALRRLRHPMQSRRLREVFYDNTNSS